MSPLFVDVRVTAPFAIGDVGALIHRDGGDPIPIVLSDGAFSGLVDGRPLRLQLTADPAPSGGAPLRLADVGAAGVPEGSPVDVETLFGAGVPIPDDGRLVCQVAWGAHCHHGPVGPAQDERRFGSYEHMLCAAYIGCERVGEPRTPLKVGSVAADFTCDTQLSLGQRSLTFGEI